MTVVITQFIILPIFAVTIFFAYRAHRSKSTQEGIPSPTDDYMAFLGDKLDRLNEERRGIARADGSVKGRCDLLDQALERAGEDPSGGAIQYQVGDILETLKHAENVISFHLAHREHEDR